MSDHTMTSLDHTALLSIDGGFQAPEDPPVYECQAFQFEGLTIIYCPPARGPIY